MLNEKDRDAGRGAPAAAAAHRPAPDRKRRSVLHPATATEALLKGVLVSDGDRPTLYICTTCNRAEAPPVPEGEPTEGRRLLAAVEALAAEAGQAPRIVPVICFANCERGCSAAIASPGKWSYMVGHIGPEHAADLLTYAEAYARSETGAVLRSGRPESFRHAIVGRFPTHVIAQPIKDAAE